MILEELGVLRGAANVTVSALSSQGWEAIPKEKLRDTVSYQRQHVALHGRKMCIKPLSAPNGQAIGMSSVSSLTNTSLPLPHSSIPAHNQPQRFGQKPDLYSSRICPTKLNAESRTFISCTHCIINHHAQLDRVQGLKRWRPQTVHHLQT
jgi:hypothetical protein